MTSCQRPKECEPSRYRHGSDPPKQVETDTLTDRKCPSTTYSLFHTIPFIQHKVVLSRPERCPAPTRGGLFHVTGHDHCRCPKCRERIDRKSTRLNSSH